MSRSPFIAIHLIWTTYGTWLPGDPEKPGHWSAMFDACGHVIRPGGQLHEPDTTTFHHARERMRESPKTLSSEEARIVAEVIGEVIRQNDVRAIACAVESTHVHLLIAPNHADTLGRLVGRLKGQSSSALLRLPDNWNRKRIWTRGYWKVFIIDERQFTNTRAYIEQHNRRAGRPASPYPWIDAS